ncbi:hypothetical protein ACFSKI_04040 [Pseudogracilibacillus auburnensis]|nr:hypothetical protein [Pseudogracilibacillus auburnensis]
MKKSRRKNSSMEDIKSRYLFDFNDRMIANIVMTKHRLFIDYLVKMYD